MQGDNILMLQFFHQRYLANRRARRPFFGVEVNFFQGNVLARLAVAPFEDLIDVNMCDKAGARK